MLSQNCPKVVSTLLYKRLKVGPPLFGLYPNGLYPNGLFMIGLSPFGLPMTFGLSLFGLFWTTGTFRLQGHLDYRHLDYRRLDYFGLQGRLDYKDIWTTKTNRLKFITPWDRLKLFAMTTSDCLSTHASTHSSQAMRKTSATEPTSGSTTSRPSTQATLTLAVTGGSSPGSTPSFDV